MKKSQRIHISYWVSILILFTIVFGFSWRSHLLAFYFSVLLLPIVMVTTYFFNSFLVPKYLLVGQYKKFTLYFFYMLVVSLYLEMLVSSFSFVVIAETNTNLVDLDGISIFFLGIALYLVVFVTSFISLVIQFRKKDKLVTSLTSHHVRNQQQNLRIRANRKNQLIPLDQLFYIESLDDYVKVVTAETEYITREKITSISDKLPDQFIRIHRSFLVNSEKIDSYTATKMSVLNTTLPISRTYSKHVSQILENL